MSETIEITTPESMKRELASLGMNEKDIARNMQKYFFFEDHKPGTLPEEDDEEEPFDEESE